MAPLFQLGILVSALVIVRSTTDGIPTQTSPILSSTTTANQVKNVTDTPISSIESMPEIVLSEFEILEFSGFDGRLQSGQCCSGHKPKSKYGGCKTGNSTCDTFWRVCIADLEPDPVTGTLLLRESTDRKTGIGGIVSRFFESFGFNSGNDSAQDKSDKANNGATSSLSPQAMKDLMEKPSSSRCRLGFFEKNISNATRIPVKLQKAVLRRLLQPNMEKRSDALDLNVMAIVELRSRSSKNVQKSGLIARQVQHYNVHIAAETGDVLLRQSDFVTGGQQLPTTNFANRQISEPEESGKFRSLLPSLFFRQRRSLVSPYYGTRQWLPSRYGVIDPLHRRHSEPEVRKLLHLSTRHKAGHGKNSNRAQYANKSSGGLRYKYRWRLKLYNRDLLVTSSRNQNNLETIIDHEAEVLLSNLTAEGCNLGYTGVDCSTPICMEGCDAEHGYCDRPGECQCRFGWTGQLCNSCLTLPHCQHGTCQRPFECKCNDGFSGMFCSIAKCRDGCHATNGFCSEPNDCQCKFGWRGENCTECDTVPGCQHGTCTEPLECNCQPGWTGPLCSIPICSSGCQNGWCERPDECRCNIGFVGELCDHCVPYPGCDRGKCAGNGTRPWTCECDTGYTGFTCEERIPEHVSCDLKENPASMVANRCINGGKCVAHSLSITDVPNNSSISANLSVMSSVLYRCECPPGFGGIHCERNIL